MNIWLVYPYGSMQGEGLRPDRPNMVADALAQTGHQVTWWGSSFEHRSKTFRVADWKDIETSPLITTRLVPTTGYKGNISFQRIRSEREYAEQVYLRAHKYPPPDMIILGEPAVFFSKPILKLVRETNAKLLVDVIDLWPELFHMILPRPLDRLGKLVFAPLYSRRRALFQQADGVIALSDSYLNLARLLAPKLPLEHTTTVYYGIDVAKQRATMSRQSIELPSPLRTLVKNEGEIWAICATTLGNNYGLKTLLEAAEILEKQQVNIKILIAGTGPLKEYVVSFIKEKALKQTIYIGSPDADTMSRVYSTCDVGLSVYRKSSTVTMPIKAFQYFAAGLPVVNSLQGDLSRLLEKHHAGLQYEAENAQSLANVLQGVASDPGERKLMARNSYSAAKDFDYNVQYLKFVDLVERLLANSNNRYGVKTG